MEHALVPFLALRAPSASVAAGHVLALVLAYLLGSIPSGLIIGKVTRGIDIRYHGSGATGTTNVLRTVGVGPAAAVLVADVAKGVGALLIARGLTTASPLGMALAGSLAVAGHNWPLFSRFRGGRGTTVAVGGLAIISPVGAVSGVLAFLPTVLLSRYVSLGSVVAVLVGMLAVTSLVAAHRLPSEHLLFAYTVGPMVLWRHRANIRRLLQGTESRLGRGLSFGGRKPGEKGQ
ncbi:MAG: glycerol-3-phosphate 1-O-acyltransferase PlsY [Chloroflexi bacterium]|nr:glycerol-3-phosphate 1-O-acyltransferase PlsY [Chloroflexota bacterium]